MKNNYIFNLLVLFFVNTCFSQVREIDIDSLVNYVNTNFKKQQDVQYLMKFFSAYENSDGSEAVHIYFDSINTPSEYIGLCAVYYKFDSLQRITSIEGWSSKGEPTYWDYPPLTRFYYIDYSEFLLIKKLQKTVPDFIFSDSTTFTMTVSEEIYPDSYKNFNRINYRIVSSDGRWSMEYYAKPELGIQYVCDSAWFVLQHRNSDKIVDVEYFIGMDTMLIDGNHACNYPYSVLAINSKPSPRNSIIHYSIAKKYKEGNKRGVRYYNRRNELAPITPRSKSIAPTSN